MPKSGRGRGAGGRWAGGGGKKSEFWAGVPEKKGKIWGGGRDEKMGGLRGLNPGGRGSGTAAHMLDYTSYQSRLP